MLAIVVFGAPIALWIGYDHWCGYQFNKKNPQWAPEPFDWGPYKRAALYVGALLLLALLFSGVAPSARYM